MHFIHRNLICFLLFVLFAFASIATRAQIPDSLSIGKVLKVGLAGSAPFVISDKHGFSGIAVEIWEELANDNDWPFEFVPMHTVRDALDTMLAGKLDLVVGPVSITSERAAQMRFSQPYYQSSLSIMSRVDKPGIWDRVKPFFSFKLVIAVGVFLVILALVGLLIWLAERNASPEQFPRNPASGIANGMWLAIVTMSTTGYGDRAPVTLWGRIITGSWMVISIIFATSMVAGIASTLTLSGMSNKTISSLEQTDGRRVATIDGSPAEEYLAEYPLTEVVVDDLPSAYAKLKNKQVDAVVYDRPQMLYFLKQKGDKELQVSKAEYYKQGYGFAMPLSSKLQHDINVRLLELSEDRKIERILQFYLAEVPAN